MKQLKNIVALFSLCLLLVMACKKVEVVAPDDFSVTSAKSTYKAGDTAIFNFTGYADMIVFFSGEPGKSYSFRNRTLEAGTPRLVFQTNMTQGVLPNNDSLRLYVSTNLAGYDSAAVTSATWTEITRRNTRWPIALSTTFITSDTLNLSDFNTADNVNFAFRATGKKYAAAAQRRWQIQNFSLINYTTDGGASPLLTTFTNTGWVQANISNNPAPSTSATNFQAWNVGQAGVNAANAPLVIAAKPCNSNGIPIQTAYPLTFDPGTQTNVDDNDDWLITAPVNLKTVRADVGVGIKKPVDVTLRTYKYRFSIPGTYTLTFVAQNQRLDEKSEVVKQLQIIVTP